MPKLRVIVGISGGVDSSVAALLLLQQGYDVHGVFMKNWDDSFAPGYCSVDDDLADAEDVCATLGIALHKVNFIAEYRERVFQYFLQEYQRGRTPNPDILCNKEIKFKAFLEHAQRLGGDLIATGHYARRCERQGTQQLLKGLDPAKDQSYFLYALNQAQLNKTLFPLGEWHKSEVREWAATHDLMTFDKKDSTGICFIGERDFAQFLGHFLPAQPGLMKTPDGDIVGEHQGLMFYTLGQRQGLGIGGRAGASGQAWYVVAKEIDSNTLIVAQGGQHSLLYHDGLQASQLHWIDTHRPSLPLRCQAKTRYRQADQACTVVAVAGQQCTVIFDQAQRAITPGQSVVFYHADQCLGGAVIDRAFRTDTAPQQDTLCRATITTA